ncbi:putative disease resistance protein RGA3 [Amaranthus tricolor]|uniref:putative disease resistance protein RGA3 n=1 Tax=Amaranthus tricolor TaxID=29722 RepID=UPI0025907AFB|nr:putative disease resistance protein RGA3 [Amaranthus tricolor]
MAETIVAEIVSHIVERFGSRAYRDIMLAKDLDSYMKRLHELKTLIEAILLDADSLEESCSNVRNDEPISSAARLSKKLINLRLCCISLSILQRIMPDLEILLVCVEKGWSNVRTDMVIGREGERDNIISMLCDDTVNSESVISIVGIGGVGKTALAQYVYHDERVKCCFDIHFWVSSTREFNIKDVLEKILGVESGMDENDPPKCEEMEPLYNHFVRAIYGKKFLLVLDNVWDQDGLRLKWVQLRRLLGFGAYGSKIPLCAWGFNRARLLDFVSKDCFYAMARGRCRGSLLAGKRTLQEWQAFRDDQLANFSTYGRDILQSLKLSYDHVDARLKLCVA